MKIQAQFLNNTHLTPLKSILISGNDDYLREQSILKIQAYLKTQSLPPSEQFDIDATGFQWSSIHALAGNGSLFDDITIITLRSAQALKKLQHDEIHQLMAQSVDTCLIIVLPKLTKAQEKQPWIKIIENDGLHIMADPIPSYKFPQLIKQRMQERSLQTTNQGYELLANSFEGNLLGLEQEIEKLSLIFNSGMISYEMLCENISDQSHHSIFQCVDFAIAQNPIKASNIVNQLKIDKIQPHIILWAIIKELRTLTNMKFEVEKGQSISNVLTNYHVWQTKKSMYSKQLEQRPLTDFYQLLKQAKETDSSIKGLSVVNSWQSLKSLLSNIAII